MHQTYFIPFVFSVAFHSTLLWYAQGHIESTTVDLPYSVSALELSIQTMDNVVPVHEVRVDELRPKNILDRRDTLIEDTQIDELLQKEKGIKRVRNKADEPEQAVDHHLIKKEKSLVSEAIHVASPTAITHSLNPGVENGMHEPDLVYNTTPHYPRRSRRRGEEGLVILDVRILATGCVDEAIIVTSSGYPLLDNSAVNAILEWRFNPALNADRPITVRRMIPIVFKLK